MILDAAAMGVPLMSMMDLVGAGNFVPGCTLPCLCVLSANWMVGNLHFCLRLLSKYLNSSWVRGLFSPGGAKSLASETMSWPSMVRPISMSSEFMSSIFWYAFNSSARSALACSRLTTHAAGSLSALIVRRSVEFGFPIVDSDEYWSIGGACVHSGAHAFWIGASVLPWLAGGWLVWGVLDGFCLPLVLLFFSFLRALPSPAVMFRRAASAYAALPTGFASMAAAITELNSEFANDSSLFRSPSSVSRVPPVGQLSLGAGWAGPYSASAMALLWIPRNMSWKPVSAFASDSGFGQGRVLWPRPAAACMAAGRV